jgi:hypothetical protein
MNFANFSGEYHLKPLIKLCPNLLAINNISLKSFVDENEVLVKSLRKLDISLVKRYESRLFELMVKRYANTLKSSQLMYFLRMRSIGMCFSIISLYLKVWRFCRFVVMIVNIIQKISLKIFN